MTVKKSTTHRYKKRRKVTVITGTRADYGLLVPVLEAIRDHPKLDLQVLVTGQHLLKPFGYTVREVEQGDWPIIGRVRLQGGGDDFIADARGLGRAITRMTDLFDRSRTDIVLVLGDRLEMFAAASAAAAGGWLVGHIHGGDRAIGVQDESYRHAITKLAHVHFAACSGSKSRLKRLGEESFRIYQTGSPALDNLSKNICRKIQVLNEYAGFEVRQEFVIVLQHPAGFAAEIEERHMRETLQGCIANHLKIIVLYPNCDAGSSGIIRAAEAFCKAGPFPLIRHLPREIYLGLLKRALALVGNSSSGMIETGRLNVDVVDVGPRQKGRDHDENVLHCDYGRENVARLLRTVCRNRKPNRKPGRIYGSGTAGRKIASVLAQIEIDRRWLQKRISY